MVVPRSSCVSPPATGVPNTGLGGGEGKSGAGRPARLPAAWAKPLVRNTLEATIA